MSVQKKKKKVNKTQGKVGGKRDKNRCKTDRKQLTTWQ